MRRIDRIEQRDNDIINLFHRYYNVDRKRMDDVLAKLSQVFYLDERFIYKIIFYTTKNKERYNSLVAGSPRITRLKRNQLLKHRDRDLIKMFHRIYDIEKKRIEVALEQVADAFYLDEDYVYKLIFYTPGNKEIYEQLVTNPPTVQLNLFN